MDREVDSNLQNVATLVESTHDEYNRQRFVSVLRKKVLVDFAKDMKDTYLHKVAPEFTAKEGRAPGDSREIRKQMLHEPVFEAWSSLRYNAQLMTWWSVREPIERKADALIAAGAAAHAANPAGGSVRLNPGLPIPDYVSTLDVHLMPGCFQTEFAPGTYDDIQGAMYHYGTAVFSGGLPHRIKGKGGVGTSISNFLKLRYPEFKPQRILDMGCTAGANTFPYHDVWPQAELYGIDVGAPVLRFAHARAEAEGVPIHFSQQNAESTDFPDNHFDLISSSFFFHELSVKATKKVWQECHRILKPGGLMLHMELPPSNMTDDYYNFYLDWDAFYNNEPHYAAFRNLDFQKTLIESGFRKDKLEMFRIPNFHSTDPQEFAAVAKGEETLRRDHGGGAVWFTFGGWK